MSRSFAWPSLCDSLFLCVAEVCISGLWVSQCVNSWFVWCQRQGSPMDCVHSGQERGWLQYWAGWAGELMAALGWCWVTLPPSTKDQGAYEGTGFPQSQ